MSYICEGTVWPDVDISTETKALLNRFFELADLNSPEAGPLMADEVFSADAVVKSGKQRVSGSNAIRNSRKNAWDHIQKRRHHISRVYFRDQGCMDLMLLGELQAELKSGTVVHQEFCARAVAEERSANEGPRLTLYQVWAISDLLDKNDVSNFKEWAAANIHGSLKSLEKLACSVTRVTGEILSTDDPSKLSLIFQVLVGSVLVIAPWYGGIVLPAKTITQPLAAGCTVVFKASELSPRTHHLVAKMFIDAGLPAGALNVVQTRREDAENVTRAVIAHPAILLMELGGKCPTIVLDDTDVSNAAPKCIVAFVFVFHQYYLRLCRKFDMTDTLGSFLLHGQICFSTKLIIVLEAIAEKFTAEFRAKAQNRQPVDVVSKRIIDNTNSLVEDARAKGCEFVLGAGMPGFVRPSALQPIILTNVTKDMAIYDSESFGPSVSLYIVKTEDEAVALANSSAYGLNAAVYSQNVTRALRVARQIECGTI
ncbi:uncharacterized protein Z519_09025 [Cladophialophora bantiana CBS 173.52]|uniref:Aldehyde dehydrogenase domain-containing protein n=1 Tax=Cladophialophora bantiana (strain ATCC 10958 / CBS 173.52 / CDC B-1940 / NIH 8579) TaxID=1442370 RepID=A0A0D2HHW3_CLAB1|nr:uncharacterized protein Z519_09025 [Cladophialophora bantiana CBS 173.52]KIW90380.1 hypothetical protein Z519_09025 [Cladophialophora bantiana CBS 173.52]